MIAGYIFFEIIFIGRYTNFCTTLITLGVVQLVYSDDDFFCFFSLKKANYENYVRLNEIQYKKLEL